MFPNTQIVVFCLMVVSLLLETDVSISLVEIPIYSEPDNPLDNVPDEEQDNQHFLLLAHMNHFMVHVHVFECLATEYPRQKRYRLETLEGDNVVYDNPYSHIPFTFIVLHLNMNHLSDIQHQKARH